MVRSRTGLTHLAALLCCAAAGDCGADDPDVIDNPNLSSNEWQVSTLDAGGLSVPHIQTLQEYIRDDEARDFKGLIIARNGKLVYEQYFNGHGRARLHDIRSATKSFTSALVGIAIEAKLIEGVDDSIIPYFSGTGLAIRDEERKREISIEHLLSMTSGLDADDGDPASPGNEELFYPSSDWLKYLLDVPVAGSPGQEWVYASANTFLLGVVIEELTGDPLSKFADDNLFKPLGISAFEWASSPGGRTVAQGNLSLRLRDMAKFGQLYLDKGRLNDVQIVSKDWVRASIAPIFSVPWWGYDAYGYGWYTHRLEIQGSEFEYFFASGNGGNKIYVIPEPRLLVVVQSAAYNQGYGQRRSLEVLEKVLEALVDAENAAARSNPEKNM